MATQWTALNRDDNTIATDETDRVLAWNTIANARAAINEQPGNWTLIKLNSRRYHIAIINQFNKTYQPRISWQDARPIRPTENPQ